MDGRGVIISNSFFLWVKKDYKEIPVKLEDLEFLKEFFDYQRLITKGDEFNLNKG